MNEPKQIYLRFGCRFCLVERNIGWSYRIGDIIIILCTDVILRTDIYLLVFLFHICKGVFELDVFGCEAGDFFLLADELHVGVDKEIFLCETFLCGAQEAVVEGDAFVEIGVAVVEDKVAAVACAEAICTLEHSSEDNHRDACQLAVTAQAVVGQYIVLQLVTGTLRGEHISGDEVRGIHDAHDGDIDIDVVVPEMVLHSVQSVDERFIGGEVLTEVVFGISVAVICAMR